MQANNAKAVNACTEAITAPRKLKAVKPKMPKGPSHQLSCPDCIAHPKHEKRIQSYKGHRLCQPKPTVQTKAEAAAPAQAPQSAQTPVKSP